MTHKSDMIFVVNPALYFVQGAGFEDCSGTVLDKRSFMETQTYERTPNVKIQSQQMIYHLKV